MAQASARGVGRAKWRKTVWVRLGIRNVTCRVTESHRRAYPWGFGVGWGYNQRGLPNQLMPQLHHPLIPDRMMAGLLSITASSPSPQGVQGLLLSAAGNAGAACTRSCEPHPAGPGVPYRGAGCAASCANLKKQGRGEFPTFINLQGGAIQNLGEKN